MSLLVSWEGGVLVTGVVPWSDPLSVVMVTAAQMSSASPGFMGTLQVSSDCKADFIVLSTEVHGSDMICRKNGVVCFCIHLLICVNTKGN